MQDNFHAMRDKWSWVKQLGQKLSARHEKREREKSHESHSVKRNTTPSSETTLFRIFRIFFFALKKTSEICNPIHLSALKVALLQEPFFTKWTKLTKYNLKLQWLLWGTLDLSRLVFPWTKLED